MLIAAGATLQSPKPGKSKTVRGVKGVQVSWNVGQEPRSGQGLRHAGPLGSVRRTGIDPERWRWPRIRGSHAADTGGSELCLPSVGGLRCPQLGPRGPRLGYRPEPRPAFLSPGLCPRESPECGDPPVSASQVVLLFPSQARQLGSLVPTPTPAWSGLCPSYTLLRFWLPLASNT